MDDGVEICVAATKEKILPDATFDGRFDALRTIGLGVDGEHIGEVCLQRRFESALLSGCEIGQELGNQVEADGFNLLAELIVKVAGTEENVIAEEGLFRAAFVGAILRRADGCDVELADNGWIVSLQEGVKRSILFWERWFAVGFSVIEKDAGAAECA